MSKYTVYTDAEGVVNTTIISFGEQGAAVVDTQYSIEGGRVILERMGEQPLLFVFNTHEHFDHMGGNSIFPYRIISSIAAREAMVVSGIVAESVPNCCFEKRLCLRIADEQVIMQLFGGHSPGSSIMYLPQRKLLIAGDLVFNGRAPWMGQADFPAWISALQELAQWDVEVVVPGHGPVGSKDILLEQKNILGDFIFHTRAWRDAGKSESEMVELAATMFESLLHNESTGICSLGFPRVAE